jgi:Galactose oxidase, central domain
MLLASDLNECIFSYLFAEELCNCFATCTLWQASKDSKSTSVLIWFNLYRHLVELPKLLPHTEDFPWHQKVTDLYSFVSGASPFTLTDARPDSGKPQKAATISAGSVQPIRLVCRSGHTASLFYIDKREVVVFFGGATHFYTFVNSYDILSVDNGVPLRTYSAVKGDVPTARWLHRACSFENNRKVIIFGGQVNDGAFSDEVYLFTLVETPAEEPVGKKEKWGRHLSLTALQS